MKRRFVPLFEEFTQGATRQVPADLNALFDECIDYIKSEEDLEQKRNYMSELASANSVDELVNTGIFHDAVGKFVSMDGNMIAVSNDY